jgi:hypothetical protein
VPIGPGQCDDDDACGVNQVCLWFSAQCVESCQGNCADPNLYCQPCATGSCCGCDDCVDACLPL